MNIFDVHEKIISDYKTYIQSFVNIKNDQIREHVENDLKTGKLWPEPLIQFNPFFKPGKSVDELVKEGVLAPEINDIFKGFNLYEHQVKAITLGSQGKDFIVTSGTGSGKSLTYLGTIFNDLLKNKKEKGVKAIIVYPMNALINSQHDEIEKYKLNYEEATGKDFPVSFAKYTGQEDEEKRQKVREELPDILLTNYMMLELILTRINEEDLRNSIYESLKYVVFDELHTYRGRQGADVALLIRRIKALSQQHISSIGTSATMVSGSPLEQRQKVALVGTTIFGSQFHESQIVTETLVSSLGDGVLDKARLKSEILDGVDKSADYESLKGSQFAKWLEIEIALNKSDEGEIIRNKPKTFEAITNQLAAFVNLELGLCRKVFLDLLEWISKVNASVSGRNEKTILPFKLHQFISQTGSVYMSLDADDETRIITLEAGYYDSSSQDKKPIFPVVFSRESGHEFICVTKNEEKGKLEPREFFDWTVAEEEEQEGNTTGYIIPGEDVWSDDDLNNLPDSWVKISNGEVKVIKKYRERIPQPIYYDAFGNFQDSIGGDDDGWTKGWFMPYRLLFDPTSGTFYDTKTNEGTKLTKLGSEGRSTSTTILSFNIIRQLADAGYDDKKQKLLSFTDNRQDAALQAGHFNDFIQTLHIRTAINGAVQKSRGLAFNEIAQAVFSELSLLQETYSVSPATFPGPKKENEDALKDFLSYKLLYDLRRSWRVVLPNLEQCGLLRLDYKYLTDSCADESLWSSERFLASLNATEREEFICQTLDFFRKSFALRSAEYLANNQIEAKGKNMKQKLEAPWRFEDEEKIPYPNFLRYDTVPRHVKVFTASIGHASGYGRYLRQMYKVQFDESLNRERYLEAIVPILDLLDKGGWLYSEEIKNAQGELMRIYQLNVDMLQWTPIDDAFIKPDPIKTRSYKPTQRPANRFFKEVYKLDFKTIKPLKAGDHTGQIGNELRQKREEKFKDGSLSALYCSPTMELGIDISSLDVVHMRNVPPNPANYAQRSGRAGRSGQAALVFTYCSNYSPHDKNYFKESLQMVSGSVAAPNIDLTNEELHKTHLNAMYLSYLGMREVNQSIADLIDEDKFEELPLEEVVRAKLNTGLSEEKKILLGQKFKLVIQDYEESKLKGATIQWYTDNWIERTIRSFPDDFDLALNRWRKLYKSAKLQLDEATDVIKSRLHKVHSPEYKEAERRQKQATIQIGLLKNDSKRSLSEFYPFRYFASEGFLPGYNFTRLPIRTYLQANDTGEYVSRPRFIAIREFGPKNIIYHNGKKFSIDQFVLREKLTTMVAKASTKSGYFLTGEELKLDTCPLSGAPLTSDKNKKDFINLVEMAETRGMQKDRISCDEEERVSQGFNLEVYFSVPAGVETITRAKINSGGQHLLNMQFIPSANLYQINTGWRRTREDSFRIGVDSGFWKSTGYEPKEGSEEIKKVQLYTYDVSDAIYIQPVKALGLEYDGIVTLMYALKRALEIEFQVESRELGVVQIGDEKSPNILIYESAEGSLGVLSQLVSSTEVFNKVIERAIQLCQFDNKEYLAPASYDDLLSYYNQRHHLLIDRFLIEEKLELLKKSDVDILSKGSDDKDYDSQFQTLIKLRDKNSETELRFLKFLYERGLRLPDEAQRKHDDMYTMPDFTYDRRYQVFVDGTPHDEPEQKKRDEEIRQALINRREFPIVFRYDDDWEQKVAEWPNIFKKVRK